MGDRIVGFAYGVIFGVAIYFLFGRHFWQSLTISVLIAYVFAYLSFIYRILRKVAGNLKIDPDS